MTSPIVIDDPADPRLTDYVDLSDPDVRRRVEAERGFFIAESPLVVRRLIESGRTVRSVLVTPGRYDALADVLSADPDRLGGAPVYVAPDAVLHRVVGFNLHRGAVAAAERWPMPSVASVLSGTRRVAVVERVNDHENLGVLFRSAAALGIDAVLLDPECSDPLYRRCVRVSIGHVLRIPWTRVESVDEIRAAGLTTFALTPVADAISIDAVDWPDRAALLFGAEGPGLSDAWLRAADHRVRIPMTAGADSLNVATAAAVAFYAATTSTFASRPGRRA
ncbi:MAG TPA: RNA methyltransferase [Acidimicrobiia bacterium]|nr:RNA methyltransferase [Acidimicrobiia bacterium]